MHRPVVMAQEGRVIAVDLAGDLHLIERRGDQCRGFNIQHRLVYQVLREERIVKVLRLWTHYE